MPLLTVSFMIRQNPIFLREKIKYLISTQIFYQQKVNIISPYLGAGAVIDDTSQTHFGSQSGLVINLSKEGKQKTFCFILKLKMIKILCFYFYCVWATKLRYVINCYYALMMLKNVI